MAVFHYTTASGRQPVKDFVDSLPQESRYEIITLLRRLELGEVLGMPHARSMTSMSKGLYELRIRDAQSQIRIFYFTKIRSSIFLIHGLRKKSQTISSKDRVLILKRIQEIKSREEA